MISNGVRGDRIVTSATNDLAARVARLEDIEAIQKLKYRYFRAIDTADIAILHEVFADDVTVDYEGGTYRWIVSGRTELVEALANSFHARAVAQHTGHHPEIEILSPTEATGIWYLTDIFYNFHTKLSTIGSALYRDTYRKIDGDWKISCTTYTRIYEQSEVIVTEPNIIFSRLALTGRQPLPVGS